MEFVCTKVLNTKQASVKQELEAPEKLFCGKKKTSGNFVGICENSTKLSTLDENENNELCEEKPKTLIVKEEIESDHENNFELLALDIKKEFELLNKQEVNNNGRLMGRLSTFENNRTAYNCQICEKTFRTFYDYGAHRKQHSLFEILRFIMMLSNNNEDFRKDMQADHGARTRVRCGFCNKTFTSNEMLAVHHKNNHKKLKFSCEYCGKVYLSLYGINKHVKSVHFKFECDKCKEIFLDRALFKTHRRQHKESKSLKCQQCEKKFDDEKGLAIHMNMQHMQDETIKMCDICHKEFINIKLLKRHYGRAHDKCFKCPHCDKAFALRCSFERHFLTHTGAKDYKCNVCGRQFSRQRSLKNHVALHSDEKSFQCNQCPKAFKTQPLLRYHKFSHMAEEKKLQCAICLQKFTVKLTLIRHLRNHTSVTVNQYKCLICRKQFKTYTWYKRHMSRCGRVLNEHLCDFCDEKFSTQTLLDNHLAQGHYEKKNIINNINE